MDKNATVPNATFNFKIEPGTAVAATDTTFAVTAGNGSGVTGSPTIAKNQAKFAPTDTTTDEEKKPADTTVDFMTKSETADAAENKDEKYATKSVTVDFSQVKFSEPGVYRWKITEDKNTSLAGLATDGSTKYLDVYVTDDGNGKLVVSAYVLHTDAGAPTAGTDKGTANVATDKARLGDKSTGFTNQLVTDDLTFGKQVFGNQASRDQYFAFTVKLTPAANTAINDDDKFQVDMSGAEKEPTANAATSYAAADMKTANNITELTGAQLTAGYTFYLKNGQHITIKGIGRGTKYAVTEDAKDYKSTKAQDVKTNGTVTGIQIGENKYYTGLTESDDNGITADVETGYLNTKNGVIPTGIIMSVAPFAIGAAAFGVLAATKAKKNAE